MDDNIWNDRGADDFLRYIKHDFFVVVYIITHLLFTMFVLFGYDPIFNDLGKRDSFEMRAALAALFIARLNEVFTQGYGLSRGESIPKIRSRSTIFKLYTKVFLWIMLFAVITTITVMKRRSNDFENQNILSKIWINIEAIALIIEVPYWFYTVEIQA